MLNCCVSLLFLLTGWTGKRCEEDEDECSQTPCQNAAICVNTPGAFACACEFGEWYDGVRVSCSHHNALEIE